MKKRSAGPIIVAVVALLLLLSGAYMAAYFLRCKIELDLAGLNFRTYSTEFEAMIFRPAAALDGFWRGEKVEINWDNAIDEKLERIRKLVLK